MDPRLNQFRTEAIKAGYKATDVDKFLAQKQQEMAMANLVKGGYIDFSTLAQSSPVLAQQLIKGGYTPTQSSSAKDINLQQDVLQLQQQKAPQQLQSDIHGGFQDYTQGQAIVPQLLDKYKTLGMDPTEIVQQYNTYENQPGRWGPANESADYLSGAGVDLKKIGRQETTSANLSATERIKAESYKTALDLTNEFETGANDFKKTSPITGGKTKLFQNILPQLADQDLLRMQSRIGPIRESVVNAISGAQVSQQEAERVMGWIPDISKSSQKNREDLKSLQGWLKTHYANITNTTPSVNNSKNNDPLGLGL